MKLPDFLKCDDYMADDILPPYIPAKWTQSVIPPSDAEVDVTASSEESGKTPSGATQPAVAATSAPPAAAATAAVSAQQPLSPRVTLTSAIPLVNRYCAKVGNTSFELMMFDCRSEKDFSLTFSFPLLFPYSSCPRTRSPT